MSAHENAERIERREAHYERFLGPMADEIQHSTDEKPVHIDIYTFEPTEDRPFYTLITGGMSDLRQNIPAGAEIAPRAELMLYASEPKPWMFDVLKGLAEMPWDDDTFLSYLHTIPNGRPMTAEPSLLTNYFLLPALGEPEEFSPMIVDGDETDILLLIPITDEEREFAMRQGSTELVEVIGQHLDPVIEEHRNCLISGQSSPGRKSANDGTSNNGTSNNATSTAAGERGQQIREAVIARARKRWERVTSPSLLGKLAKPIFGGNLEAVIVVEYSQADPRTMFCGSDRLAAWRFDEQGFRQIDPADADPGPVQGKKWKQHVLRFHISPEGDLVIANEMEGPQVGTLLRFKVKPKPDGVKLSVRGTALMT